MADIVEGKQKNAILFLKNNNIRNRLNIATNSESISGLDTAVQSEITDAINNSEEIKTTLDKYIIAGSLSTTASIGASEIDSLFNK